MIDSLKMYFWTFVGCTKNEGLVVALKKSFHVVIGKLAAEPASHDDYEAYVKFIEDFNLKLRNPALNTEFIEKSGAQYERRDGDVKLIAWYLPQYYEMEVNNKYHGQGFTEWYSVTRSIPLFTGHIQPHLPYDVGFYNLTMEDTLRKQVSLAREYGIYGFCVDYYWFSGVKTMEKPLQILHRCKDMDIHYCLNWCTENWTAKWDGENSGLIFEQKLEDGDDRKFFDDALPYFKDERYICIGGRPVLMIYKCTLFEKERFKTLLSNLRHYAVEEGFPGLYIMLTTADSVVDASEWGFDALCEYPTSLIGGDVRASVKGYVNPNFKSAGNILDYATIVNRMTYSHRYPSSSCYYALTTNFDNSPRKGYSPNCIVTINSTPDLYRTWLRDVIRRTVREHKEDDRYAFILAWNEWAESSHLEPDMYFGYGYLEATRRALIEEGRLDTEYVNRQVCLRKAAGAENIHFYIHCIESLGDVIACEPIPRYLKSKYPGCKVTWIAKTSTADVVRYNPFLDGVSVVGYLGESMDLVAFLSSDPNNIIVDCHQDGRRCVKTDRIHRNPANPQINEFTYLNYGSLLANFCLSAGLPALTDAPRFHFDPSIPPFEGVDGKYVVFHCKSAEICKDWSNSKWNDLAERLISMGYKVVEVGLDPQVSIRNPGYLDMTNVHDIQRIGRIIEGAECFFGVDSAFAHLANCVGTYGILIFGKYKYFDRPMMYTGDYATGVNSTIIFARDDQAAEAVSVDEVMGAFEIKAAR